MGNKIDAPDYTASYHYLHICRVLQARLKFHHLSNTPDESFNKDYHELLKMDEAKRITPFSKDILTRLIKKFESHMGLGMIRSWIWIPCRPYQCARMDYVEGSLLGYRTKIILGDGYNQIFETMGISEEEEGKFILISADRAFKLQQDIFSVDMHEDSVLTVDGNLVHKRHYYGKMNPEEILGLPLSDIKKYNLMPLLSTACKV